MTQEPAQPDLFRPQPFPEGEYEVVIKSMEPFETKAGNPGYRLRAEEEPFPIMYIMGGGGGYLFYERLWQQVSKTKPKDPTWLVGARVQVRVKWSNINGALYTSAYITKVLA